MVQNHPDRSLADLRGIRGCSLRHGSILSRVEASGKPGAVHLHKTPILHKVVERDGMLFLMGVTAENAAGGIYEQTTDSLKQIDDLLVQHGSDRKDVLSATIFVTDLSAKPEMNKAWTEYSATTCRVAPPSAFRILDPES